MDDQGISGWTYYLTILATSSSAGLAALLRTKRKVAPRQLMATMMTSSLAGLAVGGWLYEALSPTPGKLVTVSILSGFGGADLLAVLAGALQRRLVQGADPKKGRG